MHVSNSVHSSDTAQNTIDIYYIEVDCRHWLEYDSTLSYARSNAPGTEGRG